MKKLAPLAAKLAKGEKIGSSAEEGYIPNGVRVNFFEKERGSKRAVKMLIKKLNDKPYVTEYPMPNFDRVEPNPAVKDLAHAKIALVTSGGIVPKGNPDHIESSSASHYGEYDITAVDKELAEIIPTALDMGAVYQRLIRDTMTSKEDYVDGIIKVYNSEICDVIDDYNCSAFYEPSYVIARAYQNGGF